MDLIQKTIEPAVKLVKKIKQDDKIAIVYGHDCDTICSAIIIFKLIEKLVGVKSQLVISDLNFAITSYVVTKIKKLRPDYIISVDIAEIDQKILSELKNIGKVLVIDHHIPKDYKGITYANPRLYDVNVYLPASYIVYKLYEALSNANDISWISAVGVLADNGVTECKDLFEKVKITNPELIDDIAIDNRELFKNSLLGKLTRILDSARIVAGKKGAKLAANTLIQIKDCRDILDGVADAKKLLEWSELSDKEFDRLVSDFNQNKKTIGNILLYEVKSKFNLHSSLINTLQFLHDDNILAVYQKSGRFLDFSFRRGKNVKVDLAKLASESVKNIPDSDGGGHPVASGARIPIKYLNKFLDNLKSHLK
jgi:single-stranded DNA-specific DHH superfamily exonuclease